MPARKVLTRDRARPAGSLAATRWRRWRQGPYRRAESVAALGNRFNVLVAGLAVAIAEGAAQRKNVLRQVGFFDEALRPEPLHQVFLRHQPAVVLHQHEQGFEGFGGQGEDLLAAPEHALSDVELERAELEYLRLLPPH